MSASFRQMMDAAIKEQQEFIGPVRPLTLREVFDLVNDLDAIPISEAPPEAIADVLRFGGFVSNMIEQDPSKN